MSGMCDYLFAPDNLRAETISGDNAAVNITSFYLFSFIFSRHL